MAAVLPPHTTLYRSQQMSSSENGRPSIRIGVGAGTADDRIHPAVQLAQHGELDYLVFECLAERTVARENLTRQKDPEKGYTPRLLDRMGAVMPACLRNGVRIVSNMGAANPDAAARLVRKHAKDNGLGEVSCAVVRGDDVAEIVRKQPGLPIMENGQPVESILSKLFDHAENAELSIPPDDRSAVLVRG